MKWFTFLGCLGLSLFSHNIILAFLLSVTALVLSIGLLVEGVNKLKEILQK